MKRIVFTFCTFLIISSSFALISEKNDLLIDAKIYSNESIINSVINISNKLNESRMLEIYSYAYLDGKCISGSWKDNSIFIELAPFEIKIINLSNYVNYNGLADFKIRIAENESKTDIKTSVLVGQNLKNDSEFNPINHSTTIPFLAVSGLGLLGLIVVVRKV